MTNLEKLINGENAFYGKCKIVLVIDHKETQGALEVSDQSDRPISIFFLNEKNVLKHGWLSVESINHLVETGIIKIEVKKTITERLLDKEPAKWHKKRIFSVFEYSDDIDSLVNFQITYFGLQPQDKKEGLFTIWRTRIEIESAYAKKILTFDND